jgi:hypothetical protein
MKGREAGERTVVCRERDEAVVPVLDAEDQDICYPDPKKVSSSPLDFPERKTEHFGPY